MVFEWPYDPLLGNRCPTLEPGDIVIIDNLGSHKGKVIRQAIRTAGAKLFFLARCCPDLNPIEMFFAKLKHWLRKAARRSVDAVYNAIAQIHPSQHPLNARTTSLKLDTADLIPNPAPARVRT